jgi:hypothetical protein
MGTKKKHDASRLKVGELILAMTTLQYAEDLISDAALRFATTPEGRLVVHFRDDLMIVAGMAQTAQAVRQAADTINSILDCYADLSVAELGFGFKLVTPI